MPGEVPRVLWISATDVIPEAELVARIRAAGSLAPGLTSSLGVLLRDVQLSGRERLELGRRLRAETRAVGARLFVADRLDLALVLEADGVHLRSTSVSPRDARALVGDRPMTAACHSVDDVLAVAEGGVDAAVLSPIFASPGKGEPLGPVALERARAALDRAGFGGVRVIALGGVDEGTAPACFAAGAHGVAIVRSGLSEALPGLLAP